MNNVKTYPILYDIVRSLLGKKKKKKKIKPKRMHACNHLNQWKADCFFCLVNSPDIKGIKEMYILSKRGRFKKKKKKSGMSVQLFL